MKVIVGLGNPGKEYENTRHNAGFMALDNYISDFKVKDNYMYSIKNTANDKYLFIKPLTFMNDSGLAVRKVLDYYKVDVTDLLVIYDDMDFEIGTFKIKTSGSSGGHNGIKSIIKHIGTEEFKRIRIGISKSSYDVVDYVLGKFSSEEMNKLKKVLDTINEVIDDLDILSFDMIMNKYNR